MDTKGRFIIKRNKKHAFPLPSRRIRRIWRGSILFYERHCAWLCRTIFPDCNFWDNHYCETWAIFMAFVGVVPTWVNVRKYVYIAYMYYVLNNCILFIQHIKICIFQFTIFVYYVLNNCFLFIQHIKINIFLFPIFVSS